MNAPTTLHTRINDYLAERRRLGFQLKSTGLALRSFARYLEERDDQGVLRIEQMTDWARQDKWHSTDPATWARRLKLLRPFARYMRQFEPRTELPPDSIFGPLPQRLAPHIYTEQEIVDLMTAARGLGPKGGLRPATHETLFGLIASSGLRVSEALDLMDRDVDLKLGVITIRQTKFAKSRTLPLHPSTVAALERYRRRRNQDVQHHIERRFFVGERGQRLGQPLSSRQVHRLFEALRNQLGWSNRGAHAAPRIHDLRHSFAVRRVMLWHAQGRDIDQAMLALSTYLGHAKISNTYWYLSAVPELMAVAGSKFELFAQMPGDDHD